MNMKKQKKFIFYLFLILESHLYPLMVFLISLLALIVLHFKKEYKIRNYIGFFLFILWPCCFYIYLYCFVNAVVSDGIFLQNYEGPYSINMILESFSFWVLRFSAVSTIQCRILGFKLKSVYFKQFLFETFYCLAFISEVVGLSFSFKVW